MSQINNKVMFIKWLVNDQSGSNFERTIKASFKIQSENNKCVNRRGSAARRDPIKIVLSDMLMLIELFGKQTRTSVRRGVGRRTHILRRTDEDWATVIGFEFG